MDDSDKVALYPTVDDSDKAALSSINTQNKEEEAIMSDFYCDEVLSGKTKVEKVMETEQVLAFHHTRPSYESHIVVIPKKHISSLITLEREDNDLLLEMLTVAKAIAAQTVKKYGACRLVTNMGEYQDSKHLHWHVIYGSYKNPTS